MFNRRTPLLRRSGRTRGLLHILGQQCISTSMRSKLRHSLADLSDVEVEQLHDEAVRAAVVDVRHAAHEVVVRRAQALQHVALTLQRALVLGAALEELQGHRGAFEVLLSDADKVQLRGHMSG